MGRYDQIILGQDPKGREVTASDAANFMRQLLDDYERYIRTMKQDEENAKRNSDTRDSYYKEQAKSYALEIKTALAKIKNMNYAW